MFELKSKQTNKKTQLSYKEWGLLNLYNYSKNMFGDR